MKINADPFDAMTRLNLESTMDAVSEFFSRNTDRELNLTPVILSTVTLPYPKAFSESNQQGEIVLFLIQMETSLSMSLTIFLQSMVY